MDDLIMNQSETDSVRIREGFPKQRLTVVPENVRKRCCSLPMVEALYITDIGAYPQAPHHYVEREHGCRQAIMICCLGGKGTVRIQNEPFDLHAGHLIIIPPGIPHVYQADEQHPWSIFWIHFEGTQTQNALNSLGVTAKQPVLYVADTQMLRASFEEVMACLNYNYSDAGLLAMSSELMRLISRIKLHQNHPQAQRRTAENRIQGTIEFMQRHLDIALTLEELSAQAGQSVPYYSSLFKARTGQSPVAFFTQMKIRKACDLLAQTELSVKETAAALGYEDPYYFSRLFKKVQGLAPSDYRNSLIH